MKKNYLGRLLMKKVKRLQQLKNLVKVLLLKGKVDFVELLFAWRVRTVIGLKMGKLFMQEPLKGPLKNFLIIFKKRKLEKKIFLGKVWWNGWVFEFFAVGLNTVQRPKISSHSFLILDGD